MTDPACPTRTTNLAPLSCRPPLGEASTQPGRVGHLPPADRDFHSPPNRVQATVDGRSQGCQGLFSIFLHRCPCGAQRLARPFREGRDAELGAAQQPAADASRQAVAAGGRAAGVRHPRGDALVRQGASAPGAQPAPPGQSPEFGRRGPDRAVGPQGRTHQALLVPVRRPRQGRAQAQLRGRPRRALARGGQAPGRPSGPHDPEHRRQGLQGVPSGPPQDPPPARPGVLPRHLRRRQGVPRRGA